MPIFALMWMRGCLGRPPFEEAPPLVWKVFPLTIITIKFMKKNLFSLMSLSILMACVSVLPLSCRKDNAGKAENTSENTPGKTFAITGKDGKSVDFRMIEVKSGEFMMGATAEQAGAKDVEKPAHKVKLTKDYFIGETEVTQALWEAVMGSNPSYFGTDDPGRGSLPVECVNWDDICGKGGFLEKLNDVLKGQLPEGRKFRLPTEAEWEYAARGGHKSPKVQTMYSGSGNIDEVAWHKNNSNDRSHPVKSLKANSLGLYDMSGSVWEWCSDRYGETYYKDSSNNGADTVTDPQGPETGSSRVSLGGGWSFDPATCRVSYRGRDLPGGRYGNTGLRLAL